jgi:hypothetical protein
VQVQQRYVARTGKRLLIFCREGIVELGGQLIALLRRVAVRNERRKPLLIVVLGDDYFFSVTFLLKYGDQLTEQQFAGGRCLSQANGQQL